MMLLTTVLGAGSALAFLSAGFMLGARRGVVARDALRADLERLRAEVVEEHQTAEHERLAAAHERDTAARERANAEKERGTADEARAAMEQVRGEADAGRRAHERALADLRRLQEELVTTRAELAARPKPVASHDDGTAARNLKEVERVLAPLLEKERLGRALAQLDVGRGTRDELPRLLEAIARTAGFSTVLVSDEAGLPLATNQSASDADMLAGVWSLLLTIADRVVAAGAPAPLAVMVHDAQGRAILHRIFSAGNARFLLTAVSHTHRLAPESLDPALANLERVLTRDSWALPA